MKLALFLCAACTLVYLQGCAQASTNRGQGTSGTESKKEAEPYMHITFYNVENLFDTLDQASIADEEFTPQSKKHWDTEKYRRKLNMIAGVFDAMEGELPLAIGLAEIENRAVLRDLTQTETLAAANYGMVHRDSPDGRGIDVALLYRRGLADVLAVDFYQVPLPEPERPTREILYAKLLIAGTDTLHVLVNHWPSRRDGAVESEPKRLAAAAVHRHITDSLLAADALAAILSMGDYNDYPDNRSLLEVAGARSPGSDAPLYNLMLAQQQLKRGSYNYRGYWDFLDQILISHALVNGRGLEVDVEGTGPFFTAEMLYTSPEYKDERPNRTYGGDTYYGGYSDHLPVLAPIRIQK